MPLTVLSDADVHCILVALRIDDVVMLQHNLAEALHDYSTGTQETTAGCSLNQPQRLAIPGPENSMTMFMPASTKTSRGMKIVSLSAAPIASPVSSMASLGLNSQSRSSSRNASPRRGTSRTGSPTPHRLQSLAPTPPFHRCRMHHPLQVPPPLPPPWIRRSRPPSPQPLEAPLHYSLQPACHMPLWLLKSSLHFAPP